jgi:hypothetical protein
MFDVEGGDNEPSPSRPLAHESLEDVWNNLDRQNGIDVEEAAGEQTLTAYVRRGRDNGDGGLDQLAFVPLRKHVPDGFQYVSPAIYYLTSEEEERLHDSARPKEIQADCESDRRVFYAVLAESDGLDLQEGLEAQTVIGWVTTFAQEYLDLSRDEYRLFFSGNRSVHLHTDKFVPGNGGLEWLKQQAEAFNEAHDAQLDTSIYQTKPQFRVTGVEHYKTGDPKIPIDEDTTRSDIASRIARADPDKDYPFTVDESYYYHTTSLCCRDSQDVIGEGPLPIPQAYIKENSGEENEKRPPHNTGPAVSSDAVASAFSPYAKVGGENGRSVCLLRQTGEVVEHQGSYYVEAFVRQALGGDNSFRRYNHDGLVMLSQRDTEKWEFESGDVVIIIGGQSRNSKLIDLTDREVVAEIVEDRLREDGKQAALDTLQTFEHAVGEAGYNGPYRESDSSESTDAARLKREVDSGQRNHDDYETLRDVCCRELRIGGWERAWTWVEGTFNEEFDPGVTHEYLSTFVEAYFPEIDLPDPP